MIQRLSLYSAYIYAYTALYIQIYKISNKQLNEKSAWSDNWCGIWKQQGEN